MSFNDYSAIPAENETLGDDIYIGPNMARNDVRPALQQLAADGRKAVDNWAALYGNPAAVPFLQAGAGAVSRTYQAKNRDTVSVKDFGAVGDGVADDTAKIQAAINSGAGRIHVPAGVYKLTAALSTTVPITIYGDGQDESILLQTGAAADGIYFDYATYSQGGGIRDLSIRAGTVAGTGTGSSGHGLRLRKANGSFTASRFDVQGFSTGIRIGECFYTTMNDFQVLYAATAGLLVDEPQGGGSDSAGLSFYDGKISNYGFTGSNAASVGIDIKQSSGDIFDNIDITTFNTGVRIKPVTAGKAVRFLLMSKILGDSSLTLNWDIDGTTGPVAANQFVQCWSSNSQGDGLRVQGASVESQRFIGGWMRDNRNHGVVLNAGTLVTFDGTEITRNGAAAINTYDGVSIAAGVSGFAFRNCIIGNVSTGLITGQQRYAINIAAGASADFIITGCDLRNNTAANPIANGSNVLNWVVANNLPAQTTGVNSARGTQLRGVSNGTIAAGATRYMGPAGAQAVEADAYLLMDKPGLFTQLIVQVDTAPGAAQSFTYTVRKNGAPTVPAMTGTISGAGSFQLVLNTNPFAVSAADRVSIEVVASAGATPARHWWTGTIEG